MGEFEDLNNKVAEMAVKIPLGDSAFCIGLFRESISEVFGYYFLSVSGEITGKREQYVGKEVEDPEGKECYDPVDRIKDIESDSSH